MNKTCTTCKNKNKPNAKGICKSLPNRELSDFYQCPDGKTIVSIGMISCNLWEAKDDS